MICCKCKRPIERSYGRVTDFGNYCYKCAMQNEIEAKKAIVDLVTQERKETAEKILNKIYEIRKLRKDGILTMDDLTELARENGVEIKE